MVRETFDTDSPHLMFLVFSDNSPRNNNIGGYEMQFRPLAGEDCQAIYPKVRPPAAPEFPVRYPNDRLRVKRRGDRFSAYGSTDGKTWNLYGEHSFQLAAEVQAGPALCSHNAGVAANVLFRDYTDFT